MFAISYYTINHEWILSKRVKRMGVADVERIIGEKVYDGLLFQLKWILFVDWDPIGVLGSNGDMLDEYDSYAPEIYLLLHRKASQQDLLDHLKFLEVNSMEVGESKRRTLIVN